MIMAMTCREKKKWQCIEQDDDQSVDRKGIHEHSDVNRSNGSAREGRIVTVSAIHTKSYLPSRKNSDKAGEKRTSHIEICRMFAYDYAQKTSVCTSLLS